MQGTEANGNGGHIDLASYRLSRSADEMIHSEIRALYNYWNRLRGNRICPYRAEVDPRDMEGDVRHLFVLEDLGEGNIRFRLTGTALIDAFGFELRGMTARGIMEGKARESFVALVAETLAEPGVGYARLKAPDGTIWEMVLLPLRSNFGRIDRVIGCLHPVAGRPAPASDDEPLRFTIAEMSIRPVGVAPATVHGEAMPLPGFGEAAQTPFDGPSPTGLTAIDGGLRDGERTGGDKPQLRVVKPDDDE